MKIAATGHRPPRLGLDYSTQSRKRLFCFVADYLEGLGEVTLITGGAQGFDQAVAHAAQILGLPYIMAVPFDGQESKWPEEAKRFYRDLVASAQSVYVVSPGGYANWKFIARDKWMVDNADMIIALRDSKPEKSGTGITVDYAQKQGKTVVNLWDDWVNFRDR